MSISEKLVIFYGLFIVAVAAGLWKGGAPERRASGVLLLMAALQGAFRLFARPQFEHVDPAALLVDIVGLCGFTLIALKASRNWPLVAAALQLLSVSAHFARWMTLGLQPIAYGFMKTMPTFVILILLLIGVIRHRLRLRRHGIDPDWSASPSGQMRGDGTAP